MHSEHLDFEQPIVELEQKLEELRRLVSRGEVDLNPEIEQLEQKCRKLTKQIYDDLTPWQTAQLARHPQRPYTLDYIGALLTDFEELHGDRHYLDDPAIVAGIGRFCGRPIAVAGHQKGRDTEEKVRRNFGMPRPEGYRKAARLFRLAERFRMPVLTLIDTPGAYPGVGAEERNQSEAIAANLQLMSQMETPVVSVVIGEGGSGGALAIGVGDRLLMLQYSIYSVISPEGCASILWKDANKAAEAAKALGITPQRLGELSLVDEIIPEPLGGAHRDFEAMTARLRASLEAQFNQLANLPAQQMLDERYRRLTEVGHFKHV